MRVERYCIAKGYRIVGIVKEVGSGVNDNRKKLVEMLQRDDYHLIVCEHKDRLTRVGFNYIKVLLNQAGKDVEVINEAKEEKEEKRNSKVDYYLHTASRYIVNRLLENQITLLVIGKNDNWKQKVNLGKKTNQKFTAIPHATFINQLIYKCQLAGIKVITVGEAYTSKCSFLDLEPIKKQTLYLGKRIRRGLFKASNGRVYGADQNGSLNIIRNAVGDSLFIGQPIMRLVVSPVRIKPYQAKLCHI